MVPPSSDRISRVPPYLSCAQYHRKAFVYGAITRYGRTFQTVPLTRTNLPRLGCSPFARHYLGNRYYFLFLQVLRCFSSLSLPPKVYVFNQRMYQHDLNAKQLKEALDEVVESCVNFVGVDLNTASPSLLMHVSGFNQLIARRVVEYREKSGRFQSRKQLLNVPGVGPATFTQAAGFLKLDGEEPLDNTWIHPESYEVARMLLARCELSPDQLRPGADPSTLRERLSAIETPRLAEELTVGVPTLTDIIDALLRPGRDPRSDLPPPVFRQGILSLDDIEVGMELQGTVLNVVDFGAFVDVGLKDSALVHISQLASHFVRSPHDIVSIGDVVKVWVLSVDRDRKRIGLTMIPANGQSSPPKRGSNSSSGESRPVEPAKSPRSSGARADEPAKRPSTGRPESSGGTTGEPLRGFDELKQAWQNRPQ